MEMSVIIVAYKSGKIVRQALESIVRYNDIGHELEVIVVDNSPEKERVYDQIKDVYCPNFVYIPSDNRGFGAGNNEGAKVAHGKVLAFLNPDIILVEPIFKNIVDRMNRESIGMLGIQLCYEDLKPGFSFYYDYQMSSMKKWTLKLWNKLGRFDAKLMYTSGADMFICKDVFMNAGMFDENMFMYYEEPDIKRRIEKNYPKHSIVYDGSMKMIHLEKKSTPSSLAMIGHEMDSSVYYGKKYGLDYKKKLVFEYNYYGIKESVYSLLNKKEQSARMHEIREYMKERMEEYDIGRNGNL